MSPAMLLGALHLAACGDSATHRTASTSIELPADVADDVYRGEAAQGRAIAFVRAGRLIVAQQNDGIVFALEPAHGDTPPLVLAIARDLAVDLADSQAAPDAALRTIVLARLPDQPAPDTVLLPLP